MGHRKRDIVLPFTWKDVKHKIFVDIVLQVIDSKIFLIKETELS